MFECKICGKELTKFGLPCHINRTHKMNSKDYYDTYIEPNTEHLCLFCKKPSSFNSLTVGYNQYCCQNCARRAAIIKNREKYGVSNISQVPKINAKMRESIKQNWNNIPKEQRNYRIKTVENKIKIYCKDNDLTPLKDIVPIYGCGFIQNDLKLINVIKYKNRILIKNSDIPIIEQYFNMKVRSKHETYIYNIVKLYYPDALQNTRKIINNRELDIYIPSLKLAIEYNGIRFHNIEHSEKMKTLHLDKSIECRQQGIRLIHIYQFEDFQKQIQLLIDLLEGTDNYPNNDFNKNNLINDIPNAEIIYKTNKRTIYGAGKLVEC